MSSKPKIKIAPYIKNEKGEFVEPPTEDKMAFGGAIRIALNKGEEGQRDIKRKRSNFEFTDIIEIELTDAEKEYIAKLKKDDKI